MVAQIVGAVFNLSWPSGAEDASIQEGPFLVIIIITTIISHSPTHW